MTQATVTSHRGPGRRRRLRSIARIGGFIAVLAATAIAIAYVWSAPREDITLPGPDATPEEVVTAYIDAVNARDFDTANAIDSRRSTDLGRFSRPMHTDDVARMKTITDVSGAEHVVFFADFSGGDGTVSDGWWGYLLEQGRDGLWHIVDAGVS